MLRLATVIVLAAALLCGCETTDWFADGSEDYASTSTSDSYASDANDPLSYESMRQHNEEVNRQNCADYYSGHNIICND